MEQVSDYDAGKKCQSMRGHLRYAMTSMIKEMVEKYKMSLHQEENH